MENAVINQFPFSQRLLAATRRFLHWLKKPHVILSLIMFFMMFYMIIIPLYRMVETTLTWQPRDLILNPDVEVGKFTLFHYVRMLTGKLGQIYMFTPLKHSFTIAIGATLISLFIGGSLAWLVVRTDMPGRKLVNQLALVPYIMPSWTLAQAWVVMFKSRAVSGGTSGVFEALVGIAPPEWLSYGPLPIMICSALHYYTFFFLFVSAALMSIDSNLEEAGDLMGASRWRILRKITFPLVIPAILSGTIMTFSKVLGTFGGPNILGTPVRYYVVSTMMRGSMSLGDKADGFVLAIVLILFSVVAITFNQRLIGTRKSYETIGGRGFVANVTKLGRAKHIFRVAVTIFQVLVIVLPLGLLIMSSLMLVDGQYSFDNFSLQHWIGERGTAYNSGEPGVLRNPHVWDAAKNSIKLALWTAFYTALIGVLLGYAIVKGRGTRMSKYLEQLAYIPYVIPGIAFGAVYIAMFLKPFGPIPSLYGTFALLVIVSVAKHIPYSSRSGVSAMMQVGSELEEAGEISGANVWRRFRLIIFPLTSPGFVAGFLLTFITTMRELSLIIMLVTPDTQVLASKTMFYIEDGNDQMANVVILMLVLITAVGNLIIGKFRGGSLQKGLGL